MNSNLGYWHCLSNVKGLGPLRFKTLLALFKEPEEIYNLSLEQLLCIKGFDEKIAKEVIASKSKLEQCINKMNSEQQKALLLNVKVLTLNDKTYPHSLKKTSACSPLLYTRGNFDLLQKDNKAIAIVGTRQISDYGAYVTLDLSRKLASNGWTIVSGMAKGTDSIAHHGAISSSGTTFAVLGCGVDVVYPSEAKDLYNQILKNGVIFSEYPLGTKPSEIKLKKRNKMTVGLSKAVVIIETSEKGGTMNAVKAAFEQKKKLFVLVPKDKDNYNITGNLNLLNEERAIPITDSNAFSVVNEQLSGVD